MRYVLNRLREPSTWAGLGLIAGVVGLNPAYIPVINKVGAAAIAVLAVVLPEAKA